MREVDEKRVIYLLWPKIEFLNSVIEVISNAASFITYNTPYHIIYVLI